MSESEELIPRPSDVRDRLAKNLIEARRLRSLLRLSEAAARDRAEQATWFNRDEAGPTGVPCPVCGATATKYIGQRGGKARCECPACEVAFDAPARRTEGGGR